MLGEGISLILVDNESEVGRVAKLLKVTHTAPLDDMINHIDQMHEIAFVKVFDGTLKHAESYLHAYNIRRALLVHSGKVKAFGRDLGWLQVSLQSTAPVVEKGVLPPPVLKFDFKESKGFEQVEEKDDPYTDLGYRR